MPTVYNKRFGNIPPGAVYVGRPSKWGNPYSHHGGKFVKYKVRTREEAVQQFAALVAANPEFRAEIKKELRGKDLVCWCAPEPCHADILLEVANAD